MLVIADPSGGELHFSGDQPQQWQRIGHLATDQEPLHEHQLVRAHLELMGDAGRAHHQLA